MEWTRLLAYITGRVDKELLVRNEYLAAENRILRAKIKGRLQLSDGEKRSLAEIAHRVGRKPFADVCGVGLGGAPKDPDRKPPEISPLTGESLLIGGCPH